MCLVLEVNCRSSVQNVRVPELLSYLFDKMRWAENTSNTLKKKDEENTVLYMIWPIPNVCHELWSARDQR